MGRKGKGSRDQKPTISDCLVNLKGKLNEVKDSNNAMRSSITQINKLYSRPSRDRTLTSSYKNKLRLAYNAGIADGQQMISSLMNAIQKISQIKDLRGDKRTYIANRNASLFSDNESPRKTMRRGALMSLLKETALALPLWLENQPAPPLCGAVPPESHFIVPPGFLVAAKVKDADGDENWILAECISFNAQSNKYEVDDIDEENKERHILSKRRVVPLPTMKADPELHPESVYSKGSVVMALYPQTTCFYKGIIHEPIQSATDEYKLLFEDPSYANGYSPPFPVPPRYIVSLKENKKR